jgi:hypothetical protein
MADQTFRDAAGLEDVVRSVRVLAKQARLLVEQAGGVAERELAMMLTVAEDSRNRLLSAETLEKNRAHPLFKQLRSDAHRAVDLGFDTIVTVYAFAVETVETFLDQPREAVQSATVVTAR